MTHHLKILPQYFIAVCEKSKTFEIRRADRNFSKGDTVILEEYYRGKYTGRRIIKTIGYVFRENPAYGLRSGFVVFSLL